MTVAREKFPETLHKPYRILFFESDEIMIMGVVYIFAYLFTYWFLIGLLPVMLLYRKVKNENPRGYMKQIGYLLGIISMEGYPSSFIKRFDE